MDKPNKKSKKKESAFDDDEMLENMLKDSMPKRYGKEEENPFDFFVKEKQKEQEEAAKHPGEYYDRNLSMWRPIKKVSPDRDEVTKVADMTTTVEPLISEPESSKENTLSGAYSIDETESRETASIANSKIDSHNEEPIGTTINDGNNVPPSIEVENTEMVEVTTMTKVTTSVETSNDESGVADAQDTPKKATRISAKMRRASREEFCDTYLKKCDTKFGKPITIEAPLMPRLYRICLLTGDRKACPTSLINNIIKEILPTLEKDAERW